MLQFFAVLQLLSIPTVSWKLFSIHENSNNNKKMINHRGHIAKLSSDNHSYSKWRCTCVSLKKKYKVRWTKGKQQRHRL